MAVANDGTGDNVMTSPDGITWTAQTSAADNGWGGITYGGGLFVAVGSTGGSNQVMTSPDGVTWTLQTSAGSGHAWYNVTYGGGLFIAVSSSPGNSVMTSPDGITWTMRSLPTPKDLTDVVYGDGLFVAVSGSGPDNQVMTSPDGINWTSRTASSDATWYSIAYGNGLFVATSTSNIVMTSPDGINWTDQTALSGHWYDVIYAEGLFVAASISSTYQIMTSPDGITWTGKTSANNNWWNAVAYGNNTFVSVSFNGAGDRVMTSTVGGLDTATLSLTGTATNHDDADDVSDLTFVFDDTAFTGGDASVVTNSGSGGAYSTSLGVDFDDSPSLAWDVTTFEEASANDGTITTTATITLTNDTFTVSGGAMTAVTHYTVSNVPSGLTMAVTGISTTEATVTLSGTASAHENANDISNMGLVFTDAAFTSVAVADIPTSSTTSLSIDFDDAVSSGGPSGGSISYGCRDKSASNYKYFVSHKESLCEYEHEDENKVSIDIPESQPLPDVGTLCSDEMIITQNLKAPSRDGGYGSYTKDIVKEAKLLQAHLNRLGFKSGEVDGIIGPITNGAIKRMQASLNTDPDGYVGPITRGLINESCGEEGLVA